MSLARAAVILVAMASGVLSVLYAVQERWISAAVAWIYFVVFAWVAGKSARWYRRGLPGNQVNT